MGGVTTTYDIETSMNLGGYFGKPYDVQIAKVIQKGFVFGFCYKFLGKPRIYSCYIWDFPLYKKDPKNDIEVIKKWVEIMERTDVVVGWNSDRFDNRIMMGRVLIHKLPPVTMPQSFDAMKALKKIAGYDSYKLDDVSEAFGHGNKIKTDIELWWECLLGNKKYQKMMVDYNKRDVQVTELNYLDIRPHSKNHPNMANILNRPTACPKCGAEAPMIFQGSRLTKTGKNRIVQCPICGGKSTLRQGVKGEKPYYV